MNASTIRKESLVIARELGYETNDGLPLLDDDIRVARTTEEVIDRTLCVNVTVAAAFGFDHDKGLGWLRAEKIEGSLTFAERALLHGDKNNVEAMKKRVESLYVLAWSLGFVEDVNFRSVCPPSLVRMFPNLKLGEGASHFRQRAKLVSDLAVVKKLDLAYCLHWAVVEAGLQRKSENRVPPYVLVERRRSLEWLVSSDDFEDVSLDT